jgi:acyl-CoA thioester hydrolase
MLDYTKPEDVSFVVKRAEIDFNRSAKFDDQLIVKSEIVKLGGASVIIKQDVTKNDQILVTGMIKIAVIGQDGKPKKLPKIIKEKLNR